MKKICMFISIILFVLLTFNNQVKAECVGSEFCFEDGGGNGDYKPVITISDDFPTMISQYQPRWYDFATAFDAQDGDITYKINYTTNIKPTVPGIYYVKYYVYDNHYNYTEVQRTVILDLLLT